MKLLYLCTRRSRSSSSAADRRILADLFVGALIVFYPFVASAQTELKAAGKGSIVSGTVTLKGKPKQGVVVFVRKTDDGRLGQGYLRGKTDQDGKYRIEAVTPGMHYVSPSAPGFVLANIIDARGITVVVSPGETIEGIDFELKPGGVVTGRVSDVEGRPVIGHGVSLFDATEDPVGFSSNQAFTDDRGIYRIFGIPAGTYKVGAERVGRASSRAANPGHTFYPDVTEQAKASPVIVNEGSETANINITVGRAEPTFTLSGQVIDGDTGQPVAGIALGLRHSQRNREHREVVNQIMTSNSKGEFQIDGLSSGSYGVFVTPVERGSNVRSALVQVEIVDRDIAGIVVKTSTDGASISGLVVIENSDDKAVLSRLPRLRVVADLHSEVHNMQQSSPIGEDGSFILSNLEPGLQSLSIGGPNPLAIRGLTAFRVERNGVLQPQGIEVKSGDRISDVRIVITYANATVQGVVKFEGEQFPAGAHITVRALREEKQPFQAWAKVDTRGRFLMEALPAGFYTFEVMVSVPGRARSPVKHQANVGEGMNEITIPIENSRRAASP